MGDRLCLLICENYRKEAERVLEVEGFSEVSIVSFHGKCGVPPLRWDEITPLLDEHGDCSKCVLIGGGCLANLREPPAEKNNCTIYRPEQCFHMLADKVLIDSYVNRGAYLMNSGWLTNWQKQMDIWGFDQKIARKFFKEFSQLLLLLDTGVHPGADLLLKEMAAFVESPFDVVPVGLSHFRLYLTRIILEWHLEREKEQSARTLNKVQMELSGHAMSLDLIGTLSQSQSESEVVQKIMDTFTMLFSPKHLVFLPLRNGIPGLMQQKTIVPVDSAATVQRLLEPGTKYSWTESGNGFLLRILSGNETLGVLEVDDIQLPQYKDHYLNLALSIINVCGLALANARKYEQIQANLKEKETLLKEIHHRVKNNMTVIHSLLGLQISKVSDNKTKEILRDSQNKVHTMTMIHKTLYRSDNLSSIDMKKYLSELGQIILEGYAIAGKIALKIEIENIMIDVKQASPLGLIVNELVTNSLKYAFTDKREGEIVIRFTEIEKNQLELTLTDNGVGMPEGFCLEKDYGLGLKLVKTIAENQLDGSLEIQSRQGTQFTVKFKPNPETHLQG